MTEFLIEAPVINKTDIEALVGTKIVNIDLYRTAFTHKSALKQYAVKSSYETLEFLGDAVLGFIVTRYLFDFYSDEHEGFLTKARTKIVRGKTLSDISRALELDKFVLMDDKGMSHGWFRNQKILEDVFEALIGAIYLDLGICHVKAFINKHVLSSPISLEDDNYKDIVMRWCQSCKSELPVYVVEEYHNHVFTVSLLINGEYMSSGSGKTKKDAEQNAAMTLVRHLNIVM
jgi:ribonuclease-3